MTRTHLPVPPVPPVPSVPSGASGSSGSSGPLQPQDLDSRLAELALLPRAELRQRWSTLTGKPAPQVSAELMRLALAHAMQAAVYGELCPRSLQRLHQAGGRSTGTGGSSAPPRQRLVREWKGTLHSVMVAYDGTITWNGKTWRSLSEVARAITGTRWSGPAFFGLKHKGKAA